MNNALWGVRLHEAMARLHPDVRACVAARLFEYCAIRRAFNLHKKLMAAGAESSRALERREAADMYNKAADEWAKQNRMAKEEP